MLGKFIVIFCLCGTIGVFGDFNEDRIMSIQNGKKFKLKKYNL